MSKKKPTKNNRHRIRVETHYTLMHELTASPTQPIPLKKRTHQLSVMWEGLRAMERDPNPTPNDWRVCSDAVNLMETFITQGPWLDTTGEPVEIRDESGLLMDAITAMAQAGERFKKGQPARLSGPGMLAVRSVLEDYAALLEALPERAVIRCHRLTEIRIRDAVLGRYNKNVTVISV